MMEPLKAQLLQILSPYGQKHVLRFWESLTLGEKQALANQVQAVDFDLLARLAGETGKPPLAQGDIEPAPFVELPTDDASAGRWSRARETGEAALRAGRVAAFVVAGGQGTRLGFDGPKGAFPVGPITERSLFQVHCEKVLAASRHYGSTIPLAVMTSSANDAATRAFFEQHEFFGLPPDSVRIFTQEEMPAVDASGKLILESPRHIFMSPNGHGGSLKALWDSGCIEWLEDLGIDTISYFQVDNPLVKVIDPAFVGFHIEGAADISLKVLRRTIPEEKLGIWVHVAGEGRVVEYIDMPVEKMRARNEDGSLRFSGGSIAIHCFSVAFIRALNREGFALPFHYAAKKISFVDESGKTIRPAEPNGTKFETFVFDALAFAKRIVAVETLREEEFSPVKNAAGNDSPETARRDMSRAYAHLLDAVGISVGLDTDGYPLHPIKIARSESRTP
ncbi:MAG: UDPGP type 1 family protein [Planctomycetes bacterium]|nr:UDPGP type 1 family protein [Planctomycetota bacterium]